METLDGDQPTPDDLSVGPDTQLAGETEPTTEPHADFNEDPTHIGRFVVLRRIGEGGMGVVYSAYDNDLDRRIAIKLVHRNRARGDHQSRVRREAQAMARLSHPNVVQVYEVGEYEDQVFVAMEFVTGPTLAEWTAAQSPSQARWRAILDKYIEVGRGLAAAHAARLVHRDFKPANAIVGDDGRVRVLDFGIARAAEVGGSDSAAESEVVEMAGSLDRLSTTLTRTGALVGTPAYMSPEQFDRRSVDARSDQFSFCVALYEALYEERPFAGDTPATLMFAVISGDIRPAPARAEVPAWIREIVVRGLANKPDARWGSMTELLDALARDPERQRRRWQKTAAFGSIAMLAVIGSVWFAGVQRRNAEAAERERGLAREDEAIAQQREAEAQAERDKALRDAQASAVRARDTARVLAAQGMASRPDMAAALLRDAEDPARARGWRSAAINALQRPLSHRVLRGHADRIAYIDVSRDGRFLASASFDNTARLWPMDGGQPIVLEHDDGVISASFDRSGQRLVTASRDGTAKVWQVPAPDSNGPIPPPIVLGDHDDVVWSAQFSVDGEKVVTAARNGTVRVWSLDDPSKPQVLGSDVEGNAWWAEFSPDGRWVLSAMASGVALVWSLAEPEQPAMRLIGHTGNVGDAHFSPNMQVIATASADGTARLFHFDINHRGALDAHAILEHENEVVRVLFSPEGLRVATSSRDTSAKVWTLDGLGEFTGTVDTFDADSVVWSADFSPDGTSLALGLGDGSVQVNSLRGGPGLRLAGHTSAAFRVRYAPGGESLISGSSDGTLRLWKTDFHTAGRVLPSAGGRNTGLEHRGRLLASATNEGAVQVWAVGDPGVGPLVGEAPIVLEGHRGRIAIALDRFPRLLATADDQQPQVRLWPITGTWILDREKPKATLETDGRALRALALDDDGELLAALLMDGTLVMWRLGDEPSKMIRLREFERSNTQPTEIVFSPGGESLASVVDPAAIAIWDRASLLSATPAQPPEPSMSFEGHDVRVVSLTFSPDGRRLVSTALGNDAKIWNLDAPSEPPIVLVHGYFVYHAAFDPTGRRLLTACADTNAYLWDLDAIGEPMLLGGATGEMHDVAFSPDGKLVAGASLDGTLRVWPLDGGEPIEFVAGTSLNEVEFVDGGRRVAAAGGESNVWVWYLGGEFGVEHLVQQLRGVTQVCTSAGDRVRFVGESLEVATAASEACSKDPFHP